MTSLLYDPASGVGTPGRATARRDQVLAMTPRVLEDAPERIVVRRWFSDEVSVWRRIGGNKSDLYELQPP
jgi:hypothetical protein